MVFQSKPLLPNIDRRLTIVVGKFDERLVSLLHIPLPTILHLLHLSILANRLADLESLVSLQLGVYQGPLPTRNYPRQVPRKLKIFLLPRATKPNPLLSSNVLDPARKVQLVNTSVKLMQTGRRRRTNRRLGGQISPQLGLVVV
jgi:hypothetical protein